MRRLLILAVVVAAAALMPPAARAQDGLGYPAFNIDSWTIDRESLSRGDTFTLTMTFSNVGTFGADEVLVEIQDDGNFVGLGTSPRFGHMGIGAQAVTTLEIGISNTIETGFYGVPIKFSYHHSALGGSRLEDIRTIGVNVTGLSPFRNEADTGAPKLVIEDSALGGSTDDILMVTLSLINTGNRTATNIVVNLADTEVFVPAEGTSTAFALGTDINPEERAQITVPLTLVASPDGRINQLFRLEYASYSGGSYADEQSVPILLSDITADVPRLLLEGYMTDPDPINAGEPVRLTLTLANVGNGNAEQIFIRLGQDASSLGPLAPVGSSNVLFVEEVPASSRVTVGYDLAADASAESGLIPLDVVVTYEDAFSVEREETFTISLRLDAVPSLAVNLFEPLPDSVVTGQVIDLPLEIINQGTSSLNVSTVTVESDILLITEGGSQYIGPLEGGTAQTLIATAEAVQSGTATIIITVNYLDSFAQQQQITQRLTLDVTGEPAPPEDEGVTPGQPSTSSGEQTELTPGQRIVRAVLGFFGLGTREPVATIPVPQE
ncbi:MAG: hypothetical protein GYB64_05995 [Chloroflexi bacterium]|nr:hypothetical protein [Chloroflexota bacterium]